MDRLTIEKILKKSHKIEIVAKAAISGKKIDQNTKLAVLILAKEIKEIIDNQSKRDPKNKRKLCSPNRTCKSRKITE